MLKAFMLLLWDICGPEAAGLLGYYIPRAKDQFKACRDTHMVSTTSLGARATLKKPKLFSLIAT